MHSLSGHFYKNLSIPGALVFVFVIGMGPGALSVRPEREAPAT
jgi:hypothetical protein